MKQRTLLTTIPSDSHSWNLVYLQLLLEEIGHEVFNIGTCVPINFLIEKCHQYKPDNIVISSVNGHGHLDGINIIKEIRRHLMIRDIRVIIGGKLSTQGSDNDEYAKKLLCEGFDAVFSEKDVPEFVTLMSKQYINRDCQIAT